MAAILAESGIAEVEALKTKGNDLFASRDFASAILCYGDAIEKLSGIREEVAESATEADVALHTTLLANRAACYLNMNRPWLAMIDCTDILKIDASHSKALYRRALAFRIMGKYKQAIADLRSLTGQDLDDATLSKVQKLTKQVKEAQEAELAGKAEHTSDANSLSTHRDRQKNAGEDENQSKDDGDDEEEEGDESLDVILGFLEELSDEMEYDCLYPLLHLDDNWKRWDGGKVGGLPIWLDKANLPDKEQLTCGTCGEQMSLLLQIYSPIGAGQGIDKQLSKRAFHRSMYVFCCRNGRCVERVNSKTDESSNANSNGGKSNPCDDGKCHGLCVLRCQLPQMNDFYPADPPDPEDDSALLEENPSLAKAAEVDAAERTAAAQSDEKTMCLVNPVHMFSEHEVVTDSEFNCKAESDARVMAAAGLEATTTSLNAEEGEITAADAAEAMAALSAGSGKNSKKDSREQGESIVSVTDPAMIKFQTKTSIANDQIMRYARWEPKAPLWVSSSNIPQDHSADVPACEFCGAPRAFEFQIMPQLLSALRPHEIGGVGEIDWGTLAVYSCTRSCDGCSLDSQDKTEGKSPSSSSNYVREFVWRQPME